MAPMEQTVTRHLLEYAAGRAIFCACGSILDARQTVIFEFQKGGEAVKTTTCCARCFDKFRPQLEGIAARTETALDVTDGRQVFTGIKRTPKRLPRDFKHL